MIRTFSYLSHSVNKFAIFHFGFTSSLPYSYQILGKKKTRRATGVARRGILFQTVTGDSCRHQDLRRLDKLGFLGFGFKLLLTSQPFSDWIRAITKLRNSITSRATEP